MSPLERWTRPSFDTNQAVRMSSHSQCMMVFLLRWASDTRHPRANIPEFDEAA
jgi:hypothetical protein